MSVSYALNEACDGHNYIEPEYNGDPKYFVEHIEGCHFFDCAEPIVQDRRYIMKSEDNVFLRIYRSFEGPVLKLL